MADGLFADNHGCPPSTGRHGNIEVATPGNTGMGSREEGRNHKYGDY